MKIEPLTNKQVAVIAKFHKDYIPTAFLSNIGIDFLKLIYSSMINSNLAFCLVAVENEKPVGFVAGAINVSAFYKEFLKKNFFLAGFIILSKAFKPSFFRKIAETLFYPKKKNWQFSGSRMAKYCCRG